MTDRTTGATESQIEAASDRLIRDRMAENKVDGLDAQVRPITAIYAGYLVLPTHAIVPVALLDALVELFAKAYANSPTGDIVIVPDHVFMAAEEAFELAQKERGE